MKQYLDQLQYILDNGNKREDRTGTGTVGVFGLQSRYDLSKFPAITTKKLFWKGVVHELLWMLKGDTNIKYLVDNGVGIWNDDAYRFYKSFLAGNVDPISKEEFLTCIKDNEDWCYYKPGDLGPVYGAQWRKWKTSDEWGCYDDGDFYIDQITNLIDGIKNNPYSRRHILSAWNVADVDKCALPPCHCMAQFYVCGGKLSCHMFQRSQDKFLGEPFNIASYALLTHMIAQVCNLKAHELIISVSDAHIYLDHISQVKDQLTREPYDLPKLWLNPDIKNIDDFKFEDIRLEGYKCHPTIKAPLSVGLGRRSNEG